MAAHKVNRAMRISFLIQGLDVGGAEIQLYYLVRGLLKHNHYIQLAYFYAGGALEKKFQEIEGLDLNCLWRKSGYDFSVIRTYVSMLRRADIQIVQGYMPPANSLALIAGVFAKVPVKVASLRASNWDYRETTGTFIYFHLDRILGNGIADAYLANSNRGKYFHISKGFDDRKIFVIHNGIDTEVIKRNKQDKKKEFYKELKILPNSLVIGLIARIAPIKDHKTFLEAVKIVHKEYPEAVFLIVGGGAPSLMDDLRRLTKELGVEEKVIFAGMRNDVPELLQIIDIVCSSSSHGEAFSNSIAEAMAAGKPVIVTDVGDMAEVVKDGECGFVIPPRHPKALAKRIIEFLSDEETRKTMGAMARERIEKNYAIDSLIKKTEQVYQCLLEKKTGYNAR
ncbi:MAG: glycosyltransferase [Deltaproteobacteria bacterium]|nr:glycosyltransferase [Deltaproteobacteria bacterium]